MKKPQKQKPLNLSTSQQKLFDDHQLLVHKVCSKYRRFCPDIHRKDFHQHMLVILVKLAQGYSSFGGDYEFGAYAWHNLCKKACDFLFGRREKRGKAEGGLLGQRRFNSTALSQAAQFERSADEIIGKNPGSTFTRGKKAERVLVHEHPAIADDRNAAMLHDIREAIANLPLDQRERRMLKLRFEGLSPEEIATKMRCGKVTVWALYRGVIEKLRVHFASRGALPPGDPLPADRGPRGPYRKT